jgi:hypothetical protein
MNKDKCTICGIELKDDWKFVKLYDKEGKEFYCNSCVDKSDNFFERHGQIILPTKKKRKYAN